MRTSPPHVAIACGGTGGHLFPGLAVAEELRQRGWAVTLLISPKEVDQAAVRNWRKPQSGSAAAQTPSLCDARSQAAGASSPSSGAHLEVATLPAVGLSGGNLPGFAAGCWRSYRQCCALFRAHPPAAVLAMGGFTSAPPVLAGRRFGAKTFLHESNAIPGRANRWLSWVVDRAFVGFAQAGRRLHSRRVVATGTPVRPQFQPRDVTVCRQTLGLDPARPTLLVMGGSQGARGVNELFLAALPQLRERAPSFQFIHLTGAPDFASASQRHAALQSGALVRGFADEMETLMGAASVAVTRAGASSLAELAALRLPAVLIPYPVAADNHQWHNARAFEQTGAALLLEQRSATPELLVEKILALLADAKGPREHQAALAQWDRPGAAAEIAAAIVASLNSEVPAKAQPASLRPATPAHP